MESILTILLVIDWLCNEVHYAKDTTKNFYSRHLLADRVRDFGSAEDDIKEVYYLGYKLTQPPKDEDIASFAISMKGSLKNGSALSNLLESLDALSDTVENIKSEDGNIPRGVHAILDDISTRALRYRFLVGAENCDGDK